MIFIQVEIDAKCMQTNFGGLGFFGFGDFDFLFSLMYLPNFLLEPWTMVYGHAFNSQHCMLSKYEQFCSHLPRLMLVDLLPPLVDVMTTCSIS